MDDIGINCSRRDVLIGAALATAGTSVAGAARAAGFYGAAASSLYAEDFRRTGASDLQTLQAAFEAWKQRGGELVLGRRLYDLGHHSTSEPIFDLIGLRSAVLNGNGAELRLHTSAKVMPTVIRLGAFSNVAIQDLAASDLGYDPEALWQGANIVGLTGQFGPSTGLTLRNVTVDGALSALTIIGAHHRVGGIDIDPGCHFRNVYYGINCQENGDDLRGAFSVHNARRAYFPYGVSRHDLMIDISHDGHALGAESAALIKRYVRDTRDIRLAMNFSGTLAWNNAVTLEHQPDTSTAPGTIENIALAVTVAEGTIDPVGMNTLSLRSYESGGDEETRQTGNYWNRISIERAGQIGRGADIVAHVRPRRPGIIWVRGRGGVSRAPGFDIRHLP